MSISLSPTAPKRGLSCRLRHRAVARGTSAIAGEVELENVSGELLEIEVRSSPFQYLDLLVTDSIGRVVSDSFYGDLFSPLAEPYIIRLKPGEKISAPVSLLGNVSPDKRLSGDYRIQAVYDYRGLRSVSEPLTLVIGE